MKHFEKIRGPNSSYKTGSIRDDYSFFINMPKILFSDNVKFFSQHIFPFPNVAPPNQFPKFYVFSKLYQINP